MNLADYLSELLGQQDEVSVPGLGYFVRTHVNAYYNDTEARFYPPYHQVKFVPKPKDDEIFAQYVADKKNISLASSKYFVEKFITKLKEDSAQGKFLFAGLGSFQNEMEGLVFKPNDRIPADPAFYGYPPVPVFKVNQPLSFDQKKPVFTQTEAAQTVVVASLVQTLPQPEYFEEETEQKKRISVWLIILFALAFVGLALFGVYKFYPAAFDKVKDTFDKVTGRTALVATETHRTIKSDIVKKALPIKDTTSKTVTPITQPDTAKLPHFELIANTFQHIAWASNEIRRLKGLGINATISTDVTGPRIKVSIGSFPTRTTADSVRNALIKEKKISNKSQVLPTIIQ